LQRQPRHPASEVGKTAAVDRVQFGEQVEGLFEGRGRRRLEPRKTPDIALSPGQ
jgi:hypothetical protein